MEDSLVLVETIGRGGMITLNRPQQMNAINHALMDALGCALLAIKESVNRAYESSLSEGIGFERRQLHARFASADAHEGMAAFLNKRKPVFQHR